MHYIGGMSGETLCPRDLLHRGHSALKTKTEINLCNDVLCITFKYKKKRVP